tara:strand:- start:21346 stop:22272 length:927 start_codon:yes stop_codon:yes gene_type:complete
LKFLPELRSIARGKVLENEPMSRHTTYGIGGPVTAFITPFDKDDLSSILRFSKKHKIKTYFLGTGSNILISDKGIKGIVVTPAKVLTKLEFNENHLSAESGVMLGRIVKESLKRNLTGMESLIGVPGTLGGALVMNAGAFGSEISNTLNNVDIMKMNGDVITLNRNQIDFKYRFSTFLDNEFILLARFELKKEDPSKIKEKKEKASLGRKSSQPLRYRSAGSVFKNPPDNAAGYLIDQVGLKGTKIGGAEISSHHANFFINHGNACAKDITELIKIARAEVYKKFNIKLELEIKTIGFKSKEFESYAY